MSTCDSSPSRSINIRSRTVPTRTGTEASGSMRRIIVVATAGLFAARVAAQQPAAGPQQVTLQEAVRRALQVQPAMVQAQGTVRNAQLSMLASNGEFLPSISTGGSWSRAGGTRFNSQTSQIVSTPTASSYSGSISASVDLFTGFRRLADRRASAATEHSADAGLVNERFQVTLLTKQAFYNAIATEELVRVAEAQVARARQELQISVDKLRAGSATRSDSLRSAVDLGNARLALLQAQANLATAQATLGRQVGVDQPLRAVPDPARPSVLDTTGLRGQVVALLTAYAKLDITASNVAAATEDLRVQQERYRVGAATILDLLTSQASLTTAQTNLVQARFDYLIARAQLEALVGRQL